MRIVTVLVCAILAAEVASAQEPSASPPGQAAAVPTPAPEPEQDQDLPFVPAEPDFTLVALPTSLRLPAGRWAFRVGHRFTRPLGQGSFADLASDLFGFDSGAIVGLEVRYGLWPGTQLALLRTSDRTIQFLGQMSILQQREGRPVAVDALAAIQGFDNFTGDYTGTIGGILSRRFGGRAAVYLEPLVVLNPLPESATAAGTSLVMALGARARLGSSTYVTGEVAPRLTGSRTGRHHAGFAIERRKGGHSFQINVTNNWAMTLGQIARSYGSGRDWHIGFNITRKFY